MIEIHAYHGWGFDGQFWNNLSFVIPDRILFKSANRGYFGGISDPEFSASTEVKVIFTHSFGLHWCPKEKIEEVDLLIVFNGFNEFVSNEKLEKKKETRVLKLMCEQFDKDPESVLQSFYRNCFFPQENKFKVDGSINKAQLINDLSTFKSLKLGAIDWPEDIVHLYSSNDKIVSVDRSNDLNADLTIESKKCFEEVGHALPLVKSSDCWSYICEVVPIFRPYAS